MTISLLFWILFIVGLLFNGYQLARTSVWHLEVPYWILIFLLGVGVFGWPIKV